jgi:hypothetical protein
MLLAVPAVALILRPIAALEQRTGTLTGGLVGVQLMLHAIFVAAEGQRAGGAAGWLCCGSSEPLSMSVGAITPAAAGHLGGSTGLGGLVLSRAALVQLVLHLVAAVILAVILSRQERAMWAPVRAAALRASEALQALIVDLLGLIRPTPVTTRVTPRTTAVDDRPPLAAGLLVVRSHARRGPPCQALLTA